MRTGKTLKRLDEMLTEAMNGTFEESRYDETELSRLESRWKQYLTTSRMSMEKNQAEREKIKTLVSDISHQTKKCYFSIIRSKYRTIRFQCSVFDLFHTISNVSSHKARYTKDFRQNMQKFFFHKNNYQ